MEYMKMNAGVLVVYVLHRFAACEMALLQRWASPIAIISCPFGAEKNYDISLSMTHIPLEGRWTALAVGL